MRESKISYLKKKYRELVCSHCGYHMNQDGSNVVAFQEHHPKGNGEGKTELVCLNCHAIITSLQHKAFIHTNIMGKES